jgi:hypothetical protein
MGQSVVLVFISVSYFVTTSLAASAQAWANQCKFEHSQSGGKLQSYADYSSLLTHYAQRTWPLVLAATALKMLSAHGLLKNLNTLVLSLAVPAITPKWSGKAVPSLAALLPLAALASSIPALRNTTFATTIPQEMLKARSRTSFLITLASFSSNHI